MTIGTRRHAAVPRPSIPDGRSVGAEHPIDPSDVLSVTDPQIAPDLIIGYLLAILGILLVKELPTTNKTGRLFGYWMMIVFSAAFPLILSLIASHTAGFTKKATLNAMFFIAYCAGNIEEPQLFVATEAPRYPTAYNGMIACLCGTTDMAVVLRQYMDWENKRRDKEQGLYIDPEPKETADVEEINLTAERIVLTDWENRNFRYYL
ncbi:hypothetical protein BP5796_10290 [Coleophoma crateriformis]|uniref:Uncharacterized protein n=1 Tax=Coleophoma crateriformis TaxID=565419 RepID=A0A3D8QV76_9HELO|nr:hypothetical protein BP5796_10290 [Coleophoma crateriformis]